MSALEIWGLKFNGLSSDSVVFIPRHFTQIVTVNAEMVVMSQRDVRLMDIINHDSTCATIDGQHVFLLASTLTKKTIKKISGSDLIYQFAKYCSKANLKMFLLGSTPGANEMAVSSLRNTYGVAIQGYSPAYEPYPFSYDNNVSIIRRIEQAKPDVLFVAFGALKQELWIHSHKEVLERLGVRVAVGCGGSVEFAAGVLKRAPKVIQNLGLEGLWRLLQEPRLFRVKRLITSFGLYYIHFRHVISRTAKP